MVGLPSSTQTQLEILLASSADPDAALRAISEARKNLTLMAKMTGQLQPEQASDSMAGVTWEEFMVMYKRKTVKS